MAARWEIRGVEYGNCNCNWGCPCQFGSPTTHGHCEAVISGHIEVGHYGDTKLDGLDWVMLVQWPGEIADGDGKQQVIIDERADAAQREGLRKILHGEDTNPGATHFFVYASTMSEVLETLYRPIELSIDVDLREASIKIAGLVESRGNPITHPVSGEPPHARQTRPNGFQYHPAEMGTGTTKTTATIALDLSDSYGQFNILHMNQDGVIR